MTLPGRKKTTPAGERTDSIEQMLAELEGFIRDYDPVGAARAMEAVNRLAVPDPIGHDVQKLERLVDDLQYEEALELLAAIRAILRPEAKVG